MVLLHVLVGLATFACLAAIIYPFRPFKSRGRASACFLGALLLNVLLSLALPTPQPNEVKSDPSLTAQAERAKKFAADQAQPTLGADGTTQPPAPTSWEYSSYTDDLTEQVSKTACTTSTNRLSFSFPYNGGSEGRLCFRRKQKKLDAYLSISAGQFMCGMDDCRIRAKFDSGSIQAFQGVETSTHKTGMLFLEPGSKLLAEAKKSKQLKLQAEYFQEGSQTLTFDVSSLDMSKL